MARATVAPGKTKQITMQSAGVIHEQFAGQTLTAVFTADDGQEVSVGFTVEQSRITTITLAGFGTRMHARRGDSSYDPAYDLSADGVIDIFDLVLLSRQLPAGTGEDEPIEVRVTMFPDLTHKVKVLSSLKTEPEPEPEPALPTIKQITFKHAGEPLAGDARTLQVFFYRDGKEITSWARNWVNKVSSSFSEVAGSPITITHLGRRQDELDGEIESLPLQADQVKIVVYNLPDPARKPWPTLDGLTVILSDDAGRTLHQMVFNDIAAGRSATQTVNLA